MNNNFKNLYDNCVRISTKKLNEIEIIEKRKITFQKKKLFNNIIKSININDIKYSATLGKKYHIIYEGSYNKLIEEIIEELSNYFKPFKTFYVKKSIYQKTFMQNLSDENTYLLYLSWRVINAEDNKKNINNKDNIKIKGNNENNKVVDQDNNENNKFVDQDNNENNKVVDKGNNENNKIIDKDNNENNKFVDKVNNENNVKTNLNIEEYNDNDKLKDYVINFEEEELSD